MSGIVADEAFRLASQGIPVFPCKSNKQPVTRRGFYDYVRDPDKARSLFRSYHDEAELIGVPTGELSGISIVDIDPLGVRWFRDHIGRFLETRMHSTRRQGLHLLYSDPGGKIRNSAGKIAPGIDSRGHGGYFIWWPGFGGEVVHEVEMAPFPSGILRRLNWKPKPKNPDVAPERSGNLDALTRFVAQSALGERNCRMFWAAARAGEKVAAGLVSANEALAELARGTAGWNDPAKAMLTARNGLRRGQSEPRGR